MSELNSNDSNQVYLNALQIIFFILSIYGLIFCTILLEILRKKLKKTKHSDLILTIITVSIDFLASCGLLFRAIFTKFPYNILKEHYNWCLFDWFLNSHMIAFSALALSILSVQRMLVIVFSRRFSFWIWLVVFLLIIATLWGQSIALITSNSIKLSIIEVYCAVINSDATKAFYLTLLAYTFSAYFITIISYLSIIIFSCKQCLNQLNLNIDKEVVYTECRGIIFRSLLFLIPYIFIYSGKVYSWFYEYTTKTPRTWTMEYVSTIQISTSVVVNCLTVLYLHKDVNNEFSKLMAKLKSTLYRR